MSAIHPLADLPVTRGLGHWDPRFATVIQGPDGHLTLVDWEASGLLDPASDIACLLTHPNQEDLLTPALDEFALQVDQVHRLG
jgi:thiamine kinase-like enzyme